MVRRFRCADSINSRVHVARRKQFETRGASNTMSANGGDQVLEPLTEREATLVLETWEVVKGVGLEAAGVILFTRLFETHPEVKPLFSFFKEDAEVSGDNAGMRQHGLTVMETVNAAVEHIRNSTLGELAEDLFDLGAVHHTLQVNIAEQHFAPVGEALVFALKTALGDKFTPEVHVAWGKVYAVVQAGMLPGVTQGMEGKPIKLA